MVKKIPFFVRRLCPGHSGSLFVLLILGAIPFASWSAVPKDHTIGVTASVQASPPRITLHWPAITGSSGITIYRKSLYSTSWGPVYATLAASDTSFTDKSNIVTGTGYEYQVTSKQREVQAYGYVYSGIDLPLVDSRGKVLLLVDSTMVTPLSTELTRLEHDFVGDGWLVVRHNVARQTTTAQAATAAEVAKIKAIIDVDYKADSTNVKAVLLFGRVPVPYSGINRNPDGHADHKGAWPADVYYTQVGVTWTDTQTITTRKGRVHNVPGDGKFDQSDFDPASVKFAVGRVDMSAMGPIFGRSETDLLRQYLNKDHNFRNKLADSTAYGARCVIDDNFGEFRGDAFAQNGWRIATLVGTTYMGGKFNYSYNNRYMLWGYGCGGGGYDLCMGLGTDTDWVIGDKPSGVFTMLFGSYFGDYDSPMNFMRACLAAPGAGGLTCVWAGYPNWYFHHMGMGEPIGTSHRLSLYNTAIYPPINKGSTFIHRALLGDPTLREHIIAPPTAVTYTNGTLHWTASADAVGAGFLGYHVYRAATYAGPFSRLTKKAVQGTSWTDPSPVVSAVYQVRAIRNETSFTGTYFNKELTITSTNTSAGRTLLG